MSFGSSPLISEGYISGPVIGYGVQSILGMGGPMWAGPAAGLAVAYAAKSYGSGLGSKYSGAFNVALSGSAGLAVGQAFGYEPMLSAGVGVAAAYGYSLMK